MRYLTSLSLLVSLAACSTEIATHRAELTDPIAACAIPELDDIAGREGDFYRCVDDIVDCGPDGYPIGYGAKYAERFYRHTRPKMTAAGRAWIDLTLVCLQEVLRDSVDSSTSCSDIRTIAFDSHPGCYVYSGFCSLSWWDWLKVAATIDGGDWLSQDALRQVFDTAQLCASRGW